MAKTADPKVDFVQFLTRFPLIELPTVLGEDTHLIFSKENEPLTGPMIEEYILPLEGEVDEMTEFIPCFSIPGTKTFAAVVYWKAGLLNYQYKLLTFDEKGNFIDQKVIAGTYFNGQEMTQSMATFTEDLQVYIVSGQSQIELADDYKAATSTANRLQLASNGKIVEL